ncbi:NAD(P)H-dependent oxidoreductase [Listeria swaminathanii]|uniref:NAD(P)H-dependent oxidoreductase n=1 Tax=Listeria swaminathanii TaxID=2713501 RepID=A0ABU2IG38_9LIST|nr:NAD(P)H-dependent oxidoreductase [Listeria swaminathanii]MDT0018311.1 NAD(P)H-dependent oxidoreductase [Listeria swaminathanii]MDT0022906.1 NAD(P)H-dependent oxidoreductase [Listeria swaminathanii]MDT0034710.1 NAD(P)H-dependent oxidoreductase [Listeria swaminathanii]MDT0053535.1 NAD(P)H-dependent oxidoreductase [Listeria swaminathanii]MDT0056301.1 NAD(P)H-dependent oxidoreductase [Listeria swaminathanii]
MAKIVAIIGDPREKGTSRDMFQKYLAFFQGHPTIEVKTYDVRELAFDPNLPEGYRTEQTAEMIALKQDVRSADLLLFSYPVWWFNVPAVLKGVIDHLFWRGESYSFKDKKYFFTGPWRKKRARLIYTIGGMELQHRLFARPALTALRYPLWMSGVLSVKATAIDRLDLSIRKSDDYYTNKITRAAKKDVRFLLKK